MTRLITFVLLTCSIMYTNVALGQLTGAAKEAARKAEERALEKAIEKTANKLINKLFGNNETATDTTKATEAPDSTKVGQDNNAILGGLFGSTTVNKNFTFDFSLAVEITTTDKKGEQNVIETLNHYPKEGLYVGAELSNVLNIMDFEEMKNYSVVGGKVTVMNLQSIIDKAQKMADEETTTEEDEATLTKTGKKEKIAGYDCEEYLLKTEDSNVSMWITQEIGISASAFAKAFSTNPDISIPENTEGIVLKMLVTDNKEQSTMSMVTKEVIIEQKSFDLSKYKASDLSKLKF